MFFGQGPSSLYCVCLSVNTGNSYSLRFTGIDCYSPKKEILSFALNHKDAIDFVAGIDAMGFILGAAVARRLGVGFIPLRKHPHLCVDVITEPYVDYTGRSKILEVRTNPFPKVVFFCLFWWSFP